MDLFFNELSIKNRDTIDNNIIAVIVGVYKELIKHNVTTCRISSDDCTRLFQMADSLSSAVNVKNFYFSFFRPPYESEVVEKHQDEYYEHSWSYGGEECIGFALAFLLDTACFSIYGSDWNTPFIEFFKDEISNSVRNICTKEHIDTHIGHIENQTEIELVECGVHISDKKIVLRNDHGKDVLEDFSKRLLHSPYLIEVVNSLPYNPYERKFIRKIRENGLIEIVLPWTDKGYGIVVKTTGRTIRETQKIAQIIEEEFGYI